MVKRPLNTYILYMRSKEEILALKVQRTADGVGAMADYIADTKHQRARTATLRAERLAREAVAAAAPLAEKAPKKSKKKKIATESSDPASD